MKYMIFGYVSKMENIVSSMIWDIITIIKRVSGD